MLPAIQLYPYKCVSRDGDDLTYPPHPPIDRGLLPGSVRCNGSGSAPSFREVQLEGNRPSLDRQVCGEAQLPWPNAKRKDPKGRSVDSDLKMPSLRSAQIFRWVRTSSKPVFHLSSNEPPCSGIELSQHPGGLNGSL